MADMSEEPDIIRDPKYDPPYPQDFYRFWPKHVFKTILVLGLLMGGLGYLTFQFQVPMDSNMPPLPDEGMWVPAPEWYLFTLFQPFWYLTGEDVSWRPLFTFWVPVGVLILLFAMPFVFGRKRAPVEGVGVVKRTGLAVLFLFIWGAGIAGVVGSGYPAKTTGCPSCHNPMMGQRQALPPADMGKFYREAREQQIQVGRYRIGNTMGMGDSYKDANWQLRHFYEPTMTW
ncbi:MAG: hypothetical protein HQL52_03230 [Magnetococcales bacterium]|nr:hypothetical protein [Magnetococcales bacterium]